MKPLSTSELYPLTFEPDAGKTSERFRAQSSKIGWIHSLSDAPGSKFDIVIKDALGRVKYQKRDIGGGTERAGELVNFPTLLGEELDVSVENIRGAKKIQLFLN